jgi:rubrerythrin
MFELGIHPLLARLHASWIAGRPRVAAKALRRFAQAEQGSMLTLTWAAAQVEAPERRAIYVEQAVEEQRHARLFSKRAAELRGCANAEPPVHTDAEDLFAALGEVRFLAFLHRGERRAVVEFSHYRDAFRRAGDDSSAELFAAIVEEERHHQEYPLELITMMTQDPKAAVRASRYVAAWEAWRNSRRFGRYLAERIYTGCMLCVYVLCAPLGLWLRWVRRDVRGLELSPEWQSSHGSPRRG